MRDVIRIHSSRCKKSRCDKVQFSLDGVQEARSSSVSTDVFCVTFNKCKKVYPLRLIRPTNKFKYDIQAQIKLVIDDINKNSCIITSAVCDNPKRSDLRCALCHSATYACEYCEANAVLVQNIMLQTEEASIRKKYDLRKKSLVNTIDFIRNSPGTVQSKIKDEAKIRELTATLAMLDEEEKTELKAMKRKQKLVWPFSTMSGRLRTVDLIKYTVNRINRSPDDIDKHERKGFKGHSHLLDQNNFHFINDITVEYMHSGCLGVVKRLLELTFATGENRPKLSKRKLSDPALFNDAIRKVLFSREFSRRCRNLDLGIMKAQEYRNIGLFFFPIVLNCIEETYPNEKRVWLYMAYMLRSCVIPNREFHEIDPLTVKNACKKFYSLFEKCFGQTNCSYSIHVFPSHLLRIRGKDPLTSRSAFIYESFYSEMKNLFKAGTNSPLKQIIQNTLMKRKLEPHYCEKPVKFQCKKSNEKGLENNFMIYIYNDNNEYEFYNIIEQNDDNSYQCTQQGRYKYDCPLTPEIDWSLVGVYKKGPSTTVMKNIKKENICGKVIQVENLLLTCPLNVLTEQ